MNGKRLLTGAAILLLAGVLVWRLSSTTPKNESTVRSSASASSTSAAEAPPEPALASAARATPAARSFGEKPTTPAPKSDVARPPRTTEELLDAVTSKDDFIVVDALDDLVERKETRALSKLTSFDIKGRPHAAPTVIESLGRLAAIADAPSRRNATDRLIALLAQEKNRNEPESAGNVLTIYAALGKTLDPRAAPTLEAELLDPNVRLAAKTVIVEALVQLKQPSSSAALRTLDDSLNGMTTTDKMEEDIRRELRAAIQRALRVLP